MRTNHPKLSLANGHAKVDVQDLPRQGQRQATVEGQHVRGLPQADPHRDVRHQVRELPRVDQVGRAARVGRPRQPRQDALSARRQAHRRRVRRVSPREQASGEALPPARVHRVHAVPRRPAQGRVRRARQGRLRAVPHDQGLHADDVRALAARDDRVQARRQARRPRRAARATRDRSRASASRSRTRRATAATRTRTASSSRPRWPRTAARTCHTTFDWHQPHIDHSTWPLLGSHARTPCAACHGEQKVGAEPAAYRGIPRDCEGCHDDVHANQFKSPPAKTCATCHDTEAFKLASKFDHAKTSYPLDGKHATVACARCHLTETLRNGSTSVRYRLGYHQCKDCHANPHKEGP